MNHQQRTNFISINKGFKCENCKTINPKAPKTCRNHCKKCLFSLHVDLNIPGDRQNPCNGLMEPVSIETSGRKGYIITHKCQNCGKTGKNKIAEDDNFDKIIEISSLCHSREGGNLTRKRC